MTNKQLIDKLQSWNACQPALDWLGTRDSDQMWAECDRSDWLMWYAGHVVARKKLVLVCCEIARTVLHLVPPGEDRPRVAIETAERWANGDPKVSIRDVRNTTFAASYTTFAFYACAAAYTSCHAAPYAAYVSAEASKEEALAIIRKHWPECPTTNW
jgi:hypothetical protein